MNSHKHARLTLAGRALLVNMVLKQGWAMAAAAEAVGISCRIGFKWLARFRAEGAADLADRSSRPQRSPAACPPEQVRQFEQHRRERIASRVYLKIDDALGRADADNGLRYALGFGDCAG